MTVGAVWLIVLSLVLFIAVASAAWWLGLLDNGTFDSFALAVLALLFLLFWLLPSLTAVAAWAHYR